MANTRTNTHTSVLVVSLFLLCACAEATRLSTVRINKPLSAEAKQKLGHVLDLLRSDDWMNKLMREISEKSAGNQLESSEKLASSSNPPSQSESVALQGMEASLAQRNAKRGAARRRDWDDPSRKRARRSVLETDELLQTISVPSPSPSPSPTTTTAFATADSSQVSVSAEHQEGSTTTKPTYFPPCPAKHNYCVYGDCVDLGYSVYVCNCADGYTGMACEILDLQNALEDLIELRADAAAGEDPTLAVSSHPEAQSSATAIAQFLAGEVKTFH